MTLAYALLGLLAAGPRSGYQLAQIFQRSLAHTWSARHSQIYPTLAQLRDDGLIRQSESGPRNRKTYEITEAGLAEVRHWLRETEPERANRHEAMMRVFFLWLIEPEEAERYLRAEADYHRRQLAEFEQILASGSFVTPSTPLALEWGLRYEAAIATWAESAAAEVAEDARRKKRRRRRTA
ncbi:MAG: PadR family transcriptional regulator [Actinomycetota bacterium]|nr:PadR family transcriptional regulator [Actinomycetota bacterium]